MNALPFVVIFITIIALTWSSLSVHLTNTQITSKGFISHMLAFNDARSKIEELLYQDQTKEKKEEESEANDRSEKVYKSPRLNFHKESSKLFLSKDSDKEIKKAFESLIDQLYLGAPFYEKRLAERISEVLFPLLHRPIELHTVTFEEDDLDEAWYQMLKGGAFPSLSDYVALGKPGQLPLYARYASIPVLEALLGASITHDLLQSEEERYYNETTKQSLLPETEFTTLLSKHNLSQLKKYFDFSASPKVEQVIEGHEGELVVAIKLQAGQENVESRPQP